MIDPLRRRGIETQLARAKRFLAESVTLNGDAAFDHLIAAVYAGQAACEIAKGWAENDFPSHREFRSAIEGVLDAVPRASVIEAVRIHDFHRFGLRLAEISMFLGPLQLRAAGRDGVAVAKGTPMGGVEVFTSPGSSARPQRVLQIRGFEVFDGDEWIHLRDVLTDYLGALPVALDAVETLPVPSDSVSEQQSLED